jgi:hypothetical protein
MERIFLPADPTLPLSTSPGYIFSLILMQLKFAFPQPANWELLLLYMARQKNFALQP